MLKSRRAKVWAGACVLLILMGLVLMGYWWSRPPLETEVEREFREHQEFTAQVNELRRLLAEEPDPVKKHVFGDKLVGMARHEVNELAKDPQSVAFPRLIVLGEFAVQPMVEALDAPAPRRVKEAYRTLLAGIGSKDADFLDLLKAAAELAQTEEGKSHAQQAVREAEQKLREKKSEATK